MDVGYTADGIHTIILASWKFKFIQQKVRFQNKNRFMAISSSSTHRASTSFRVIFRAHQNPPGLRAHVQFRQVWDNWVFMKFCWPDSNHRKWCSLMWVTRCLVAEPPYPAVNQMTNVFQTILRLWFGRLSLRLKLISSLAVTTDLRVHAGKFGWS